METEIETEIETEEQVEKPTQLSLIEEAKAIRDEINKAKEDLKAENDRKEKLQIEATFAGRAEAGVEDPEPVEITDEEYADKVQKGEVNPFADDGLI